MSQIETSPGGVGFIRTAAKKSITRDAPSNGAARRGWLTGKNTAVVKANERAKLNTQSGK